MPIGPIQFNENIIGYLEFGTGDIRMGTVHVADSEGETQTMFAFAQGEPREIGFIPKGDILPIADDIKVLCRFTKLVSLDVFIKALQEHRKILKKEKEAS